MVVEPPPSRLTASTMPSEWAILAVSARVAPTLVGCRPSMVANTIVPLAVLPAIARVPGEEGPSAARGHDLSRFGQSVPTRYPVCVRTRYDPRASLVVEADVPAQAPPASDLEQPIGLAASRLDRSLAGRQNDPACQLSTDQAAVTIQDGLHAITGRG